MALTIENLLNSEQLLKANAILANARFIDGSVTAKGARDKKNNRELAVGEEYVAIVELVENALRGSSEMERKVFPRYITRPIISRYETGMYYKEHIDMPIQGSRTQFGRSTASFGQGFVRTDFSMTLFLDDPSTYEGGELEVAVDGEKRLYKLSAGSAVFYSTGSIHCVRPVIRGVRTAAVAWIQSMIRNSDDRRLLWEAYALYAKVSQAMPGSLESFAAMDHYSNMLRHFADI